MPQSYIDQLKPVGIVMTAGHITVANGASCSAECPTQPDVKLGLIDAAGTESITTYKMKLESSGYQVDRYGSNVITSSFKEFLCLGLWDLLIQ